MQRSLGAHAWATLSMLGGSSLVFSVVLYMNQQEKPPKADPRSRAVEFQLERPPPPKREQRPRRARRERQPAAQAAPDVPQLSLAISGVALELGGVAGGELTLGGGELLGSIDEQGPLTEGALDEVPRVRSRGTQQYPDRARRDGLEGYVLLNVLVRADGSVGRVELLDAQPRGVFDEAALDFVRGWSFQPGTYQGAAVDAWVKQRVVFKLQHS